MIRLEREGAPPVAVVVLDRPGKRNALTPEMLAALGARAVESGADARALVLRGEGAVFCAGFDLRMCREAPDGSVMRALLSGLADAIHTLRGLPIPVVAAIHGAAIAGGCALLGGADVVVADRGAKLGYPVVRLGVSPAVSAPFLRPAVGDGACRTRMMDPEVVSGEEAARIGLVHELVERPEDVVPRAMDVARGLAAKPAEAVAATRRWLDRMDDVDRVARRALEVSLALAGSEEEGERLARLFPSDER